MAIPVLETGWDVQQSATARTTVSFGQPSGSVTGDLLMAIVIDDNAIGVDWSAKTGWNLPINIGTTLSDSTLAIYWRIQDGTESWPETFSATRSNERGGVMLRITGVNTSAPINASLASAAAQASSYNILGVTTDIDDCLILYGFTLDGGDGAPFGVTGTGWSEFQEIVNGTATNQSSGCMGQRDLASQGSAGTAAISFAGGADGCIGAQIAIAPAAGGVSIAARMASYRHRSYQCF